MYRAETKSTVPRKSKHLYVSLALVAKSGSSMQAAWPHHPPCPFTFEHRVVWNQFIDVGLCCLVTSCACVSHTLMGRGILLYQWASYHNTNPQTELLIHNDKYEFQYLSRPVYTQLYLLASCTLDSKEEHTCCHIYAFLQYRMYASLSYSLMGVPLVLMMCGTSPGVTPRGGRMTHRGVLEGSIHLVRPNLFLRNLGIRFWS